MVRGNPAALMWINHKAKKIWKKYGGKEGKYKKAIKRPQWPTARSIQRKKRQAWAVLQIMPLFFLPRPKWVIEGDDILICFHRVKYLINRHVNHPVDCHKPAFIPTRGPTIGH